MNDLCNEILQRHQVRKSKSQKRAFLQLVSQHLSSCGISCRTEKGGPLGSVNLVVGDVSAAKVVLGAHYDTAAALPFPNFLTPNNMLIYLLYNLAICVPLLLIWAGVGYFLGLLAVGFWTKYLVSLLLFAGFAWFLLFGPANRHTVNDNTSGVITLLSAMLDMPPAQREKFAFVFFDHEEAGLFGSAAFEKRHRQDMKNKPLLNFDCVSDGETMLFVLKKAAQNHEIADLLQRSFAFTPQVNCVFSTSSKSFYPSDQVHFLLGVGIAAMNTHKLFGLYLDKIHTAKDQVFREENVAFLVQGIQTLANFL